ncbi:hypothetical protein [Methyloraptor flagellatus]|uniref:Uncharacterized protein n=1 Tax=Methyloraptor flagellatus TaxID=3162530 RepID=A0AAU7X8G2_9HYPH
MPSGAGAPSGWFGSTPATGPGGGASSGACCTGLGGGTGGSAVWATGEVGLAGSGS